MLTRCSTDPEMLSYYRTTGRFPDEEKVPGSSPSMQQLSFVLFITTHPLSHWVFALTAQYLRLLFHSDLLLLRSLFLPQTQSATNRMFLLWLPGCFWSAVSGLLSMCSALQIQLQSGATLYFLPFLLHWL